MKGFKQKFYRVFKITYEPNMETYTLENISSGIGNQFAMFDTQEIAERFVQNYHREDVQLTILTVWE